MRWVRDYTVTGARIMSLARNQRELARALGVSQQTVSKKLRGQSAILLADLERLASHYNVPVAWFFWPKGAAARIGRTIQALLKQPGGARADLAVLAMEIEEKPAGQALAIVKAAMESHCH